MSDQVDVAVIGAGVVGCAIASVLARQGLEVIVLERERRAGAGITSRNSGVIHSGIYYPPTSHKARTCVRGNELLYPWLVRHGVSHRRVGKLVVALQRDECSVLARIHDNATASGAKGVRMMSKEEVAHRQPGLPSAHAALFCPETGIVDAHGLTASLLADALHHGAWFVPLAKVTAIHVTGDTFHIETTRDHLHAATLVNAAGLYADEIAAMVGLRECRIYPCRGDYFRLRSAHRYEHLIYPVRRPEQPGLGIHLTLELDGAYRLGPDSEYVEDKDDFRPAKDKLDAFLDAGRRLLGPLTPEQLTYDGCGLRPKLRPPDGSEEFDFVLREHPSGCLHLVGIDSPGLTAAMALAEDVGIWRRTGAVPPTA